MVPALENLAHERFGNDENLADVFVLYYGGKMDKLL
jgi:hypothetical protein